MSAESTSLRSFSVTTAARASVVDGQPIGKGQVLALDAGRHLLTTADSVEEAAMRALEGLRDFDLVTCYRGAGVDAGRGQRLRERIEQAGWEVEVEMVPGGQRHEHLPIAVERWLRPRCSGGPGGCLARHGPSGAPPRVRRCCSVTADAWASTPSVTC
jgi:dihydroxyacetone kinase-like predicted kinase